ncbi:4Fe-4S binding protein [Senegalimassilia sp.]|uniref:4Fe-4S binding protein n=1 Tax=Senegalimassilia sp. TaxID=1922200 RepID=UPI002850058B|nr:4Fe-4S binding protein [Senegalimassilia sp.]MDR3886397.1 4Fe-4S binding protein [Senegalimassilia sp.]
MKKMKARTLRTIVTFAVLVLVAIGYFTAWGIGNLSGFGWDAFSVLCPLGYLESLVAGKTFVPRAFISFVVILVLIMVLGRVFCAWICPMPTLQRLIPGVRRRKRKDAAQVSQEVSVCEPTADKPAGKVRRVRFDSRFGVLLGALASAAIFGFPVFCLICPVGLTFATVLLVMRLFAFGDVTWAVVVVPLVLLIEVVFLHKWCGKFCPLGALISLVSGANRTLRPHVDDASCLFTSKGVRCFACSKACPEHLDVRRPQLSEEALGNCTKCRECADACPAKAISFPVLPKADGSHGAPAPVDGGVEQSGAEKE